WISFAPHDLYFTIGETVGTTEARFPDGGLDWLYTPPAVALDWWEPAGAPPLAAAFTTVSNWATYEEWLEDEQGFYSNDKRDGFLPYLELPALTSHPLELALALDEHGAPDELVECGWRIRE